MKIILLNYYNIIKFKNKVGKLQLYSNNMRSVKPYKMDQNNPLIHQVSINSHKVKPTHESWRSTNLSFGSHGIYKTKGLLHRGVSRYIKVCCISVPHTWIIPKQVCVKWIQYWEPVGLLWCHFTFISCSVHVSTNPGFAYLEKLPYRWTSEYFIYICFQFFHWSKRALAVSAFILIT